MKKKVYLFGIVIIIGIAIICIGFVIRNKLMDYGEFVDKKCGFEISRFLEYDKGTVGFQNHTFACNLK